jgi:hypothetical protein
MSWSSSSAFSTTSMPKLASTAYHSIAETRPLGVQQQGCAISKPEDLQFGTHAWRKNTSRRRATTRAGAAALQPLSPKPRRHQAVEETVPEKSSQRSGDAALCKGTLPLCVFWVINNDNSYGIMFSLSLYEEIFHRSFL